jgi:hypothetical protein
MTLVLCCLPLLLLGVFFPNIDPASKITKPIDSGSAEHDHEHDHEHDSDL